MSESRIKELQVEKVRLSNLDADNMLDKQKYKERMLQIDMMIEELEKETDPFDKMFPGQTITEMNKGGEVGLANGGEIDMSLQNVSRGTMDMEAPQMQPSQDQMAAVQQIMEMVAQMMQSGASEEEIIAALKELGLDDQDIAMIMQAIMQQGQQQGQQANPIDSELSQMM
jgi:hypothetical protein